MPGSAHSSVFMLETLVYILIPLPLSLIDMYLSLMLKDSLKPSLINLGYSSYLWLQPMLVKQFGLLFSCVRMGQNSGDVFFTENLNLRCYTTEHLTLLGIFGAPLLLLYILYIPYSIYSIFSQEESLKLIGLVNQVDRVCRKKTEVDRAVMVNQPAHVFQRSYGSLFRGYKTEAHTWELKVMARKMVLVAIGVSSTVLSPFVQVMGALLVLCFSLVLHAFYQPYDHHVMNYYESISLSITIITLINAQFVMMAANESEITNTMVANLHNTLSFVINILYVLVALCIACRIGQTSSQAKEVCIYLNISVYYIIEFLLP
jgi:hypothetical protein